MRFERALLIARSAVKRGLNVVALREYLASLDGV